MHKTCLRKHNLSRLGKQLIKLDPIAEEEARKKPLKTWALNEVAAACAHGCMPLKMKGGESSLTDTGTNPNLNGTNPNLKQTEASMHQIVLFEDLSEWLFKLDSQILKIELCYHFISFLGGEEMNLFWEHESDRVSYESGIDLLLARQARLACVKLFTGPGNGSTAKNGQEIDLKPDLKDALNSSLATVKADPEFLERSIALLKGSYPGNLFLARAGLEVKARYQGMKPARRYAKALLKENKSHFGLWGLFADLELRCNP